MKMSKYEKDADLRSIKSKVVIRRQTSKIFRHLGRRRSVCLILPMVISVGFLIFSIPQISPLKALMRITIHQQRVAKAFPKDVLNWIENCGQAFPVIVLEPDCLKCLGADFYCQMNRSSLIYRFATPVDTQSQVERRMRIQKILSCSKSLGWRSKTSTKKHIFDAVVLRKSLLTLLVSILEKRPKYMYIYGTPYGADVYEPARAFLRLDLTYYKGVGTDFLIPYPVDFYLWQWPRSRFLECRRELAKSLRKQEPKYYDRPPVLPDSYMNYLVYCRDLLLNYRFTVMLGGGTALGWYRECDFIPHTTDTDIMFLATEWNPQVEEILKKDPVLKLSWILGTPDDSLELTVHCAGSKIDINALFEEGNQTYTGAVMDYDRKKIRWYYPSFKGACTADLKGHLFYVRCDIEDVLIAEYGPNWHVHYHSYHFSWYKSHHNVKIMEKYNDTEWPLVYRTF